MKKLLFILLIFSCQARESAQNNEILAPSTPEAQGISSKAILNFIEAAEEQQPNALHSFMLLRHGRVLAQGWWNPYNPDSPHLLYSLSKSFTSTAIGMAVTEGLLSLDDPVISFFPEETPDSTSHNLQQMRIRDLLRMTTGHATDSYNRIKGHPDGWVTGFLSLPVEHKPGSIFIYNTGATYMLSAILQKVTGQTLTEFLQPRLFDPLEIETPFWQSDPEGINLGGTGLFVKTSDIAKFGQLYLQKGNWKGEQIIPEDWIEMATSLQTSNGSNPESDWDQGYGFQFWQCRNGLYRGDGAFGQYCIVMDDYDAVLAITSGSGDMQGILNIVYDNLLDAMKEDALPADEESYLELQNKLKTLELEPIQGNPTSGLAAEISGKKYILEGEDTDFEAITFGLVSNDKSITMWHAEEELTLPIGYGEMLPGKMTIPGLGNVPVASSGAWTSENTFRAMMYNYESPHAIIYDFTFEDNKILVDSEFNVTFGPAKRPQVIGKNNY
jgi:CubicO group peptidase (beta-lactamase class C family)